MINKAFRHVCLYSYFTTSLLLLISLFIFPVCIRCTGLKLNSVYAGLDLFRESLGNMVLCIYTTTIQCSREQWKRRLELCGNADRVEYINLLPTLCVFL